MSDGTSAQKVALITGGGRGIGYGIAECLAAEGYDLAIGGVRAEERVEGAWADMIAHAQTTEGDLCVVTHGLVLRSLVNRILPTPEGVDLDAVVFRNTSVTVVEGPPWEAALIGCAAHLNGDLLADGALA